jgi:hypothetical protein
VRLFGSLDIDTNVNRHARPSRRGYSPKPVIVSTFV